MPRGNTVSEVITQICKECGQQFFNNGRNAQKIKWFCSSYCCSKYWNRIWRLKK